MSLWVNATGNPIVDDTGAMIECDTCPCEDTPIDTCDDFYALFTDLEDLTFAMSSSNGWAAPCAALPTTIPSIIHQSTTGTSIRWQGWATGTTQDDATTRGGILISCSAGTVFVTDFMQSSITPVNKYTEYHRTTSIPVPTTLSAVLAALNGTANSQDAAGGAGACATSNSTSTLTVT